MTIATAAYFVPGSTVDAQQQGSTLPPSELYQPWLRDSDVPETWRTDASADAAWLESADAEHDSAALRDCAPANFTSDGVRSPGFHVLCVLPAEAAGALARIAAWGSLMAREKQIRKPTD